MLLEAWNGSIGFQPGEPSMCIENHMAKDLKNLKGSLALFETRKAAQFLKQ